MRSCAINEQKDKPSLVIPAVETYQVSAEKIGRMLWLLIKNGFASIAET